MRHIIAVLLSLFTAMPCIAAPPFVGTWTAVSYGGIEKGKITFKPNGSFNSFDGSGRWKETRTNEVKLTFSSGKSVTWFRSEGGKAGEYSIDVSVGNIRQDNFQLIPAATPSSAQIAISPTHPLVGNWDKGPIHVLFKSDGTIVHGQGTETMTGQWKVVGPQRITYQFTGKLLRTADWEVSGNRLLLKVHLQGGILGSEYRK